MRRKAIGLLSWILIITGLAVGAWTVAVWQWQDPVTALYTAHRQSELSAELDRRTDAFAAQRPKQTGTSAAPPRTPSPASLRRLATAYAASTPEGDPLGKLIVPRLGLRVIFVNGTNSEDLHAGPGRHRRTGLPGQQRLVYIAGHRTTFGAPFADIDRMRPGDPIILELPYGVFSYRVQRTRIVDARDLSVLRPGEREVVVLQACHPRFLATQRILVYAAPTHVAPPPAQD